MFVITTGERLLLLLKRKLIRHHFGERRPREEHLITHSKEKRMLVRTAEPLPPSPSTSIMG